MSKGQAKPAGKSWEGRVVDADKKLNWTLPSPFKTYGFGQYDIAWGAPPLSRPEFVLLALSWTLRSKPEWQRKAADPEIRAKWRAEMLEQAAKGQTSDEIEDADFVDEKMVDYVLAELDGYAKIADEKTGIERGCFEGIWYSDRLFSDDLLARLKSCVRLLEDVPDDEKDWHPNSNKQVLDLVHPSLYCVVYGRTHAYLPDEPRTPENFLPVRPPTIKAYDSNWISEDFSWLPSDFAVDEAGAVKLLSPYINNLQPKQHQALYRVIEDAIAGFVPMWERVMGDINRAEGKRVAWDETGRLEPIGCIWGGDGEPYPEDDCPSDVEDEDAWLQEWRDKQPKTLPQALEYNGQLEERFKPVSLRGRTIQCIIKLANIHLTPESPEYSGGSWHVEGMTNESIVASGIYARYYDEQNITESHLQFRVATDEPEYHGQDDGDCMRTLYGMDREQECVQDLGAMATKAGRALAWPNIFQHCVSAFKLADPTKHGHRKILAIFLVDPTIDPIVSASDVPPQQAEWAAEALEDAYNDAKPGSPTSTTSSKTTLAHMPRELRDLVKKQFPESVMTMKEAEAFRLLLMKERTAFVSNHTEQAFAHQFNMCEH
ncbi:hypothetical protein MIND_01297900 [Mycena indigotica]|uniref:Uncharacterized protein n=1 Tax=Mycena indigotica TaxID=2126181 RepID=A0A8H6S0W8_9AGAR|nr:uncharacterized protein MIND_01297900 [Mycena indigotica]KAF7290578.1 hypothetical protein MIND_01297900 [Mycena indigotica]